MKINEIQEEIPFGNFIIEKPNNEEVKENTSFTGYDYMIKFNIPYKSRVTYPCKAKVLFQDVCNQVGLIAGNIDFVNCDYMILGNPFTNNEDCRTVLSNIAQLAGGFAKIGRDNKVYIKTLKNISDILKVKDIHRMNVQDLNLLYVNKILGVKNNSDESIDGNNYFEDFAKNNMWGELNSLVLGLSSIEGENTPLDDKDSIQKNGLTEIVINDNYFLRDEKEREKVIEPLWNSLKGIKYLPFKTEYYGYPYIDSGDMIYIEDTNDKGYVSYIFNHTFTYDGGYSGKIETEALTKVQTAYKNTGDIKTRFRNVERKVDKIEGVIEDVIEEQTEHENKMSQMLQTIDSFTQRVENEIDVTREVVGLKEIVLENCIPGQVLEFEIDGNNTVFDYLLPDNNLLPSDDLLPYGDSQIEIIRQVKDEEGNISEESEIIDLGITERLRQKEDVKDRYRLKDNKAQVIRKIGVLEDGTTYVLPTEKIEELGELKITLNEGTNKIRIVNYTANLKARYVIKNDFSTTFASYVQVSSLIRQTTQEILMQLSQKVGDEEIIAKLNMAIKDGQSIIELIGDIVKIKSKYFELTEDGQITALKGIIAGLVMSTNSNGDSYLSKNYKIGDKTYQSGLFIPKEATGGEAFIYAGVDITNGSGYLRDANTIIQHNGLIKAKWFSVNGESGYFFVDYDSGKRALDLNKDGIIWKLDNEKNNNWCAFRKDSDGQCVWLYDAPSFQIYNGVHKEMMLNFKKYNPLSTNSEKNGSQAWLFADINVGGSRHDNINTSIYVQGYEVRTSASDIRLKKRIKEPKKNALTIINQIPIRQFQWRNPKKHKRKFVDFGYLAQPTQEILKSLVIYNADNDTYQMDLSSLSALHTKAIQEVYKENKVLKDKVDKQEKIISFLINKLNCEKELAEYMKGEAI